MILTNSLEADRQPVVIFDSGVGGLPYLQLATRQLPSETLCYVADTAHYPYGDKSEERIREIVLEVIGRIIRRFRPKCIVIACNTASVTALAQLRQSYDVPFVGVVPAVKPAAEGSLQKRFGVLATLRTVEDGYLGRLIEAFAGSCQVTLLPAGRLRDIVEKEYFSLSREAKIREIRSLLAPIIPYKLDALVLGCTHFIHLEEEIKEVLGSAIQLVDSRRGVINQLARVLADHGLLASRKTADNCFYVTDRQAANRDSYRRFAAQYALVFKGEWVSDRTSIKRNQ